MLNNSIAKIIFKNVLLLNNNNNKPIATYITYKNLYVGI